MEYCRSTLKFGKKNNRANGHYGEEMTGNGFFLHYHALPFQCSQFPFLPIAIHIPKLKSYSHCNAIPTWLTFARRAGPDDKAHLGILLLTQCVYTR